MVFYPKSEHKKIQVKLCVSRKGGKGYGLGIVLAIAVELLVVIIPWLQVNWPHYLYLQWDVEQVPHCAKCTLVAEQGQTVFISMRKE